MLFSISLFFWWFGLVVWMGWIGSWAIWIESGKRKRPLGFPSGLSEDSRRWCVTYVSDSLSRWGERLVFTAAKPAAI